MKRSFASIICLCLVAGPAWAQRKQCTYTKISKDYDFAIDYTKTDEGTIPVVHIKITHKTDKKLVQKIESSYSDGEFVEGGFLCTSRSYTTGYNKNARRVEGDVGDLVVADLNFDGREDLAVKAGQYPTGAGMEWFNFYIQDSNGRFVKDNYLTKNMRLFPDVIDVSKRILSVDYIIGANADITTYRFQYTKTRKWVQLK